MKTLRMVVVGLLAAAPVYAGPVDQATFFSNAPVLGEGGLLALAVVTGVVGIRLVSKYQNNQK